MRLIDADALDEVVLNLNVNRDFGITRGEYKLIDSVLFEFPVIEERKKGKWLPDKWGFWKCSACGFPSEAHAANVLYKFCPVCGAKMEGEENEAD